MLYLIEFLHQTTTLMLRSVSLTMLYLIEFLHQTTTYQGADYFNPMLYLIEFLHQTTTRARSLLNRVRCILLNFYIKPQPTWRYTDFRIVVSY